MYNKATVLKTVILQFQEIKMGFKEADDWCDAEATYSQINVGRAKFYRMVAGNEFVKPIKVGRKASWRQSYINDWKAKRAADAGQ